MVPLLNQQEREKLDFREDGSLSVINVWYTLQGEGPYAGTPSVFVRLAGCNVNCPMCFGIGTKARIPRIHRANGPVTRLDKVEEGERILTLDNNMNLVETEVRKILYREVKEWIEVTIAGKTYDVTPEHPFFTSRGLISADNLELHDQILEARPEEIIAYKKLGDKNPMRRPEVMKKKLANTDYVSMGRNLSRTLQKQIEEGTYVHPFDRLSKAERRRIRKAIRKSKLRERNPNWTGLHRNLLDVQEAILRGKIIRCDRCEKENMRLLIHHRDENHNNDDLSNLAVWCHRCHNQYHQRGYNFWNGKRADGKELLNKHNGQPVEMVRWCHGKLPVINLSCAPYPTYLANRMWVHNCDTDYTTNRQRHLVDDLVTKIILVSRNKTKLVVLTGGEPFRQNIVPLIQKLTFRNYHVQIETNGTMFPDHFPFGTSKCDTTIVCSPKAPSISQKMIRHLFALKYVLEAGCIDETDGLPTSILGNGIRPARPNQTHLLNKHVYVQPMDDTAEERNKANLDATVKSAMKHGYRLSIQLHKLLGLD